MAFNSILGQETACKTLQQALVHDRVHHGYRFEGPDGVGKESAALQLAQALLCEAGVPDGCEECSACRRALTFSEESPRVSAHPDLLLIERGLYPSELIGGKSEAVGISVEQIRQIVLPRIGYPPHEGQALVIIVRRAEELTVSAANALLKTLEEPPPRTHFILLTSRPGKLLDTILSRTLALRFRPLPDSTVQELLEAEGLDGSLAEHAGGSMARARALSEPEASETRREFVAAADVALSSKHSASAIAFSEVRPEGRDALREQLSHLGTVFAKRARTGDEMALWASRHAEVLRALNEVERNGSPALVLEAMMTRLRECS